MRTNNGKVKNVIISVYFILIVFAILMATVFSAFKDLSPNPFLSFLIIMAIFAIIFVSVYLVSKYFEYDSDGVKVVIMNRGLLLGEHFNYREKKLEFDKEQLVGFKLKNYFFYKSLMLHIKNSKGINRNHKFNITLVTKKKRKYIKQSLSKMIKNNRKQDQ